MLIALTVASPIFDSRAADFQMPSFFLLASFSAFSRSLSWCSKSRMPEGFQRRASPAETSAAFSEVREPSVRTQPPFP